MTVLSRMPRPRAIVPALLILTAVSCGTTCDARRAVFDGMAAGFARKFGVREIRAEALIKRLAARRPTLLIDTREPAEQSVSILAGAVRLTPRDNPALRKEYRDFQARYANAPAGTEPLIVVYCAGGYRSAEAINRIPAKGQKEQVPVLNLHGGIIAYANAGGLLVEPVSGKPVQVVHGYNSYWSTFVMLPARAVLKPPIK